MLGGSFLVSRTAICWCEREALRFQSGTDLVAVLEESHRSEFYVTNDNVSWLIAYNDHDYLIGVGEAADWIAQHVGAGSHIDACDSRRSS